MDTQSTLFNALVSLLTASPAILVAVVGSVLVLLRRRRHPKASLLALIGFLIYLATSVFFPLFYSIMPALTVGQYWSGTTYMIIYRGIAFIHYFVEAAALALLLAAVLAGRGAQTNTAERNFA